MTTIDGSRHLDLGNVGAPAGRFAMERGAAVRVVVGADAAATLCGQQAAWMAVNLLCRITEIIATIEIVAPDHTRTFDAIDLHSGRRGPLDVMLAEVARSVAGDAMGVTVGRPGDRAKVALVIGDGEPGPCDAAVYITARRWAAWVGSMPVATNFTDEAGAIGAYLAAALGVGELFKHCAVLLRPGDTPFDSFAISGWSRTAVVGVLDDLGDIGPETTDVDLGDIHLAGVGAVAHAFIAALRAVGARGRAVFVDGEPIDDTNLNRYLLATLDNIGDIKAELGAAQLRASGLAVFAANTKWENYMSGAVVPDDLPADLRDNVANGRFDTVFSFVDRNTARHTVQNAWPRRLLGASTPGLAFQVHDYDLAVGGQCIKCHNPLPTVETLEAVAERLLGLPEDEQRSVALNLGWTLEQLRDLTPANCAQLGAADLSRLGTTRPDFSISFVTAAAGVMAAAIALRAGTSEPFSAGQGRSLYFSFYVPELDAANHARKLGCDCGAAGGDLYQELWG